MSLVLLALLEQLIAITSAEIEDPVEQRLPPLVSLGPVTGVDSTKLVSSINRAHTVVVVIDRYRNW